MAQGSWEEIGILLIFPSYIQWIVAIRFIYTAVYQEQQEKTVQRSEVIVKKGIDKHRIKEKIVEKSDKERWLLRETDKDKDRVIDSAIGVEKREKTEGYKSIQARNRKDSHACIALHKMNKRIYKLQQGKTVHRSVVEKGKTETD